MHHLSESIRAGDTNRVLSALQNVSDNIFEDPDPAITFMKMERKYCPFIIDGGTNKFQHISEGRGGLQKMLSVDVGVEMNRNENINSLDHGGKQE